jgi:hypothetical protein
MKLFIADGSLNVVLKQIDHARVINLR